MELIASLSPELLVLSMQQVSIHAQPKLSFLASLQVYTIFL
jgi:hypothetical protein